MNNEANTLYILMVGNAYEGLTFYGPFNSAEDAIMFADEIGIDDTWLVIPLKKNR